MESEKEEPVIPKDLMTQIHIAEYQSIMARITNFLTIGSILIGALIALISVIVFLWNTYNIVFCTWAIVVGCQFYGICAILILREHYLAVFYLDSVLHPLIEKLTHDGDFWQYEAFLANRRGNKQIMEWESIGSIMEAVIIAIFLTYRIYWGNPSWEWWGDSIGLILSLGLFTFFVLQTRSTKKIRIECYAR